VFPAAEGGPLRRSNFRRRVWLPATTKVGVPALRFHDLRHTAATLAAASGTSLKVLMARIGHSSAAAALRYQHVIDGQDAEIVRFLERFDQGPSVADGDPDGPPMSVPGGHVEGTPKPVEQEAAEPYVRDQDFSGGDDGTRTHDPLLANQDGRNAVLTRTFAAQRRARTSKLSADQTRVLAVLVILARPR
jgi:hypothetical protein